MRKTYAYNSIIFGILLGILIGISTKSAVIGILAGLGIAVVGFVIIRLLENALYKGADKLTDKATEAIERRKAEKAAQNGTPVAHANPGFASENLTRFPAEAAEAPASYCPSCGAALPADSRFCPECGASIPDND